MSGRQTPTAPPFGYNYASFPLSSSSAPPPTMQRQRRSSNAMDINAITHRDPSESDYRESSGSTYGGSYNGDLYVFISITEYFFPPLFFFPSFLPLVQVQSYQYQYQHQHHQQ